MKMLHVFLFHATHHHSAIKKQCLHYNFRDFHTAGDICHKYETVLNL